MTMLVAVAFFNWIGGLGHYYYTTNWYDWPMHFMGGVFVALFLLWIREMKIPIAVAFNRFFTPRNLIIAVFCVGIVWEIFELSFGITDFHDKGYIWDTTHDLLNDFLGACLVAYLTRRSLSKKTQ